MDRVKTYTAAIYCRLSKDDEQAGQSVSIETQKIMLTEFCREQGFEIFNLYVDDGFSGLNFRRPAFMQLISDINKGRVNLVVTKDLSRLGRDYIQTGYFTDVYFAKKQVRYIAVSDGIDTKRNDNDIAPFKNVLNDMYAKDISRKIKLAKKQRSMKGFYTASQPPFGYVPDPNNHNRLIIDEEAAAVVREIFQLAMEKNSYLAISRKLTEQGIPTPGEHKVKNGDTRFLRYLSNPDGHSSWSYQTVRTILQNSVYIGNMVNHKTEVINYKTKQKVCVPKEDYIVVPNQHEAIISAEDFEKVQEIVQARRYANRHGYENVFCGRVFCRECGSEMILIAQRTRQGEGQPLLKCFNHYKNPEQCKHYHAVLYEDLYEGVLERLREVFCWVKSSHVYEKIESKLIEKERQEKAKEEKERITRELYQLRKNMADIRKTAETNVMTREGKTAFLRDLMQHQEQLARELKTIECGQKEMKVDPEAIREQIHATLELPKLTEEVVSRLIQKIEVGERVKTAHGPQRDIVITYTF